MYEGEKEDELYNGLGILQVQNKVYFGTFCKNEFVHGVKFLTPGGVVHAGTFHNGIPHGSVVLLYPDTGSVVKGVWCEGELRTVENAARYDLRESEQDPELCTFGESTENLYKLVQKSIDEEGAGAYTTLVHVCKVVRHRLYKRSSRLQCVVDLASVKVTRGSNMNSAFLTVDYNDVKEGDVFDVKLYCKARMKRSLVLTANQRVLLRNLDAGKALVLYVSLVRGGATLFTQKPVAFQLPFTKPEKIQVYDVERLPLLPSVNSFRRAHGITYTFDEYHAMMHYCLYYSTRPVVVTFDDTLFVFTVYVDE